MSTYTFLPFDGGTDRAWGDRAGRRYVISRTSCCISYGKTPHDIGTLLLLPDIRIRTPTVIKMERVWRMKSVIFV
nr:hypothetical protein BaRGS_032655 [Batillaria attramentaria]